MELLEKIIYRSLPQVYSNHSNHVLTRSIILQIQGKHVRLRHALKTICLPLPADTS